MDTNNDFPIIIKAVRKYLVHCPRCDGEWQTDEMGMTECPKCAWPTKRTLTTPEPDFDTFRHQRINSPVGQEIVRQNEFKTAQSDLWQYYDLKADGHLYDENDELAFPERTFANHQEAEYFLSTSDIRGTVRTAITPTDTCKECGQRRPGDDRVSAGMKCRFCTYTAKIQGEFVKTSQVIDPLKISPEEREKYWELCRTERSSAARFGRKYFDYYIDHLTYTGHEEIRELLRSSSSQSDLGKTANIVPITICPKCKSEYQTKEIGITACPKCGEWMNREPLKALAAGLFPLKSVSDLRRWKQISFQDFLKLPQDDGTSKEFSFGPSIQTLADIAEGKCAISPKVQQGFIERAIQNGVITPGLGLEIGIEPGRQLINPSGQPMRQAESNGMIHTARTKLGDRNIHWQEMYTRDTAYFKQMYEDLVGKGCYLRFEGRDADSGDEYFAIVGPGHMHDPEPQFFAGTRKLPSNYSAGGLYFSNIREAMKYAEDTWGLPIPQDANYGWTSKNLRGLSAAKMDGWRDTHTKDSVMENFQGPIRKDGDEDSEEVAQDFPISETPSVEPVAWSVPVPDNAIPIFAITEHAFQKIAMPLGALYKNRRKNAQNYILFDPNEVREGQDPRFEAAVESSPSLRTALEIALRDQSKRQFFYDYDYSPEAGQQLSRYFIAYSPTGQGIYLVSVGPYLGDYFGEAVNKYYVGPRKLNIVSNQEIQNTVGRAIQNYIEQYSDRDERGNIRPNSIGLTSEDFNIPQRDGDGLLPNNKISLNQHGQQVVEESIARRMGIDTTGENWQEQAAVALEAQQQEWLNQHREWLPADANVMNYDRQQLDSVIKRIWLKYRHDQAKSRQDPAATTREWDSAQLPPPPQLKNNIMWREGAQSFRQMHKEPKFTVSTPPAIGSPTFRIQGEGTLRKGHRVKFVYQMPDTTKGGESISGRRMFGKKMYLVQHASQADDQGYMSVTLAEPYATPNGTLAPNTPASQADAKNAEWESNKVPTSIEVQANTVQTVSVPGDRMGSERTKVVVDWGMPIKDIARTLGVTTQRAQKLKKANMIANFGFDSLAEALQHFREHGLPIAPEDEDKLTTQQNVTTQDLATMAVAAEAARPAGTVRPHVANLDDESSEEDEKVQEEGVETDATKTMQPDRTRKVKPNTGRYTPKEDIENRNNLSPASNPLGKAIAPKAPKPTIKPLPLEKEEVPDLLDPQPLPQSDLTPVAPIPKAWRPKKNALGSVLGTFKSLMRLANQLDQDNKPEQAAEVRRIIARNSGSKFAQSLVGSPEAMANFRGKTFKIPTESHEAMLNGILAEFHIDSNAQGAFINENSNQVIEHRSVGGPTERWTLQELVDWVKSERGWHDKDFPIRVAGAREDADAMQLFEAIKSSNGPRTVEWLCKRMLWPLSYVQECLQILLQKQLIETDSGRNAPVWSLQTGVQERRQASDGFLPPRTAAGAFADHHIYELPAEQIVKGDFIESEVYGFFRVDTIEKSEDGNYYFTGMAGHRTIQVQIPHAGTISSLRKKNAPIGVKAQTQDPIQLVKKDCGLHSGRVGGPCVKCKYQSKLMENPKYRAGLQYTGTPWAAVVGDPAPTRTAQVNPQNGCSRQGCKGTYGPMDRGCGARICNICGDHKGLERCFCGWSVTRPGQGRAELHEMGETIDSD